jgi:hypothetical protein
MICSVIEACKDGLVRQGLLSCEPLSIPDDGIQNNCTLQIIITQIIHGMRISTVLYLRLLSSPVTSAAVHLYNNGYITNPCSHVSVGQNLISRQNSMRNGLHLREDGLKLPLCVF